MVDSRVVFVDATHIKAHANNHKYEKLKVPEDALFYKEALNEEIKKERDLHEQRALKSLEKEKTEVKEKKISTTDPEAGWFHKGEHKEVFAYVSQVGCDCHGWILGYTAHAGNLHDSRTFKSVHDVLLDKFKDVEMMVMDAGYKTPAIAHLLKQDGITPVFPYKRPMTKKGFLKKREFEYYEQVDSYLCPNGQWLSYSTTNKDGYKEYKSKSEICVHCPLLSVCTKSQKHIKLVTRHIWAKDLEACEELRRLGVNKKLYDKRKETIERLFGNAKEFHGLRYTNENGRDKLKVKLALTFSCLNMKKLAKIMRNREKDSFLFCLK